LKKNAKKNNYAKSDKSKDTESPLAKAKPEEKVVSVFDVSEAFDKFMKRVESMTKDAEVTTRNKEMIDFLQSASAQYHEAKAMNARVSLSAE
jgi:hypothetical protein